MSIQLSHHRDGSGAALLLIHGIGHHWQAWRPVVGLLREDFDVIACDSPGFGASPPLPTGMAPTVTSYADAFEWFIAELGLERPHVAGNSMGGAIALELARRRAVASVTAFSPVGFWTAAERRFCQASLGLLAGVPSQVRPALSASARTRLGRTLLFWQIVGYPARLPASEARATLRDAWARVDTLRGALNAFDEYTFQRPEQLRNVPVTIAWGAHDRLLWHRPQSARARSVLPFATHVTLGAGHVPFHDDPAACAAVIRARAGAARESTGAALPS